MKKSKAKPAPPSPVPEVFRPVVFTRSWHPLSAQNRQSIFREWSQEDDRFRALWDQLGEEFEQALLAMLNAPGDSLSVHRHIGELRAIVNLKGLIMSTKADAL